MNRQQMDVKHNRSETLEQTQTGRQKRWRDQKTEKGDKLEGTGDGTCSLMEL